MKFSLVENQKWPLLLKIAEPLKSHKSSHEAITFFSSQIDPQNGCLCLNLNSETMKWTISHELPNRFCQNMCHTDAFIEFVM